MKSRGPCLPKPFNLGRGDAAINQNKLSRSIGQRGATDNDAVNNEPKRGSGSRAELLRVQRNCELRRDAETEPDGEEF
jgi:hypothetical protein